MTNFYGSADDISLFQGGVELVKYRLQLTFVKDCDEHTRQWFSLNNTQHQEFRRFG